MVKVYKNIVLFMLFVSVSHKIHSYTLYASKTLSFNK